MTGAALPQGPVPAQLRTSGGLELAQCCLPARDNAAGGDWCDAVSLPGGRTGLIVGDVMGHGLEAVATMLSLRSAAHALAGLDPAPAELLSRLDQAAELAAVPFATCSYAVVDPSRGSCVMAQAGHHPPVLVLPGGMAQPLGLPPGLPLGARSCAGSEQFAATRISLPPGATLAMYTDGLVESRARPLELGTAVLLKALSAVLGGIGSRLTIACRAVTAFVRSNEMADDATLVLARQMPGW